MENVWTTLWHTAAPSEVQVFGLRLLLQRLPTRDELTKRRAIDGNLNLFLLPYFLFMQPNLMQKVYIILD